MIRYFVVPRHPGHHIFQVSVSLTGVAGEQLWRLPAWIPGSYMIRDFARHILNVTAEVEGHSLAITKLDKDTWKTASTEGTVTLHMEVHAHDNSVREAFLDNRYAFFNGTSLFLCPVGHEGSPCEVDVLPPGGGLATNWKLATGLTAKQVTTNGFGSFKAANYDELIDHPVLMGELKETCFEVMSTPHRVVLNGPYQVDTHRFCRDLKAICETHAALFDDQLPMDSYSFLTMVTANGYGGLEHRNSSALVCARRSLPRRNEAPSVLRDDYRTLLGLFSHEYFHSWNIKRIKPAAFSPYDLSKENYTELLWAFEGITSYYDDLALVRSGVIGVESYLELLGQTLTRVARGHGRFRQTVTASSFDAWTRFYKQDASAPNAIVSYYSKGAWIALALDLTLRKLSAGKQSLDDVMRLLWQRYGKTATGVAEQGIQQACEEVAGQNLDSFFNRALYATEDIDLTPLLASVGINLFWRSASNHADKGGKPGQATLDLGALIAADPAGVKLRVLYEQGSAMKAGLSVGDVLLAIDGHRVELNSLDEVLAMFTPGDRVPVHVFRDGELIKHTLVLQPGEPDFAWLDIENGELSEAGRHWLHIG